jgi:hypothetical protein
MGIGNQLRRLRQATECFIWLPAAEGFDHAMDKAASLGDAFFRMSSPVIH